MKDRTSWTNWAGNQSCAPTAIRRPTSEDELVAIVKEAAAAGTRVKCVGAGHSFTPIACTDGVLRRPVRLRPGARTRPGGSHDHRRRRASPSAALCDELDLRGLALENMGDIAYQSIAGATATATHGTGWHFGNISSRIVGLRLIAGDGSIVEATPDENPEVLAAARVGVGALGIVSTVTIEAVQAFRLHAIEEPMRVDEVLADFDGYMSSADHVEFYWVPHTGWALTKRNRRTDEPAAPRGKAKELIDDLLLPNVAFGALCRIGRRKPSWIPRMAKILPSTGRLEYTDRSDRVFTSPRRVHFYEMEYAIPRDAVPEALNRVRPLVDEVGHPAQLPGRGAGGGAGRHPAVHRPGPGDGLHRRARVPGDAVRRLLPGRRADHGQLRRSPPLGEDALPGAETLAERYPRWDEFQAVRRRLDPEGRFTNQYLERVLGPVTT